MNNMSVREITKRAKRKAEKATRKEVKSLIRTLKADIKRVAKKGVADFRCKIRNAEIYGGARKYFQSKGFRCWEYSSENNKYLVIEW